MNRIQKITPEDFLRGEPVPSEGIRRGTAIMEGGPLFRYSHSNPQDSEVSLLERDFARFMGTNFALAGNSCSSMIVLALRTADVGIGTKVLVPSFTFTAVPSAIVNIGAIPLVVECNSDYRVDIDDLEKKITPDTKVFLLSHMRGNTSDMDAIMDICGRNGIAVVEDAAHGRGCKWKRKLVGSFGSAACFSFQSNKIVNAGEGGMLTTDDPKVMAQAVILSGAYERLHEKHFWGKELENLFVQYRKLLPLYNMRMTEYTAALIRPQLHLINERSRIFRDNYTYLTSKLAVSETIQLPFQDKRELRAPDSIQFRLKGFSRDQMTRFMETVRANGLPLSAFGADKDNARVPWNWQYIGNAPEVPMTRVNLANVCDMRLPSTLTKAHLDFVAETVLAAIDKVR